MFLVYFTNVVFDPWRLVHMFISRSSSPCLLKRINKWVSFAVFCCVFWCYEWLQKQRATTFAWSGVTFRIRKCTSIILIFWLERCLLSVYCFWCVFHEDLAIYFYFFISWLNKVLLVLSIIMHQQGMEKTKNFNRLALPNLSKS